jgi:hypothetical protein
MCDPFSVFFVKLIRISNHFFISIKVTRGRRGREAVGRGRRAVKGRIDSIF